MSGLRRADTALSVLLLGATLLMAALMWPPRVRPVLQLELERNALPIQHLDQERVVIARSRIAVDVLDLAAGGRLRHRRLGVLGYGENFFLDLRTTLVLDSARVLHFEVESDDGFALEIEGRRICAFTGQRGLVAQRCRAFLEAGEHLLHLSYFQAGGPAGLRVRHAASDGGPWALLGEDTAWLRLGHSPDP